MTENLRLVRQRKAKKIVLTAKSSRHASVELIQCLNEQQSLKAISKKLGLKSTGYISDILTGRRQLSAKHYQKLCEALGLDTPVQQLLLALHRLEKAKTDQEREKILLRLSVLKKIATVNVIRQESLSRYLFFSLEMFAAFGLFNSQMTYGQLEKFFTHRKKSEIEGALSFLLETGTVAERDQGYQLVANEIKFETPGILKDYSGFMRDSLNDAIAALQNFYDKPNKAHFETAVLSFDSKNYEEKLTLLKSRFQELYSELEEPAGDTLIRINVQAYPVLRT